ncbi:hypothetical protein I302_108407 [Kwoniella bestiolae CBS 10118]|uniref:Uncharacterized protein n=1 Tax=Kwoniella bestiolae CBS 10118 TaxID=1296100 RepID=A0A1B9FVS0_9TREE|nr:hypothetical protein I302_07219 [Kwoniella bestiolae CBS 10118]OCF22872.1 hypothetical protein I302_07219 [Kwoniella bestiolae CBS 10118]
MTDHQTSIVAQPKFWCPLPSTQADWFAFQRWREKNGNLIARITRSYLNGEYSRWSTPGKKSSHDVKSWYSSLPWVETALQWMSDLFRDRKDPSDVLDASLMANSYTHTIDRMGYYNDTYSHVCMPTLNKCVQELRPALEKSSENEEKLKLWESQVKDLHWPDEIPKCSKDREDKFLKWYDDMVKEGVYSEE